VHILSALARTPSGTVILSNNKAIFFQRKEESISSRVDPDGFCSCSSGEGSGALSQYGYFKKQVRRSKHDRDQMFRRFYNQIPGEKEHIEDRPVDIFGPLPSMAP
jgi:hypothetical protein